MIINHKKKNKELVYGIHSIQSILEKNPHWISRVYSLRNVVELRLKLVIDRIKEHGIFIQKCDRHWLDVKFRGISHQGIVAEIFTKDYMNESSLPNFLKDCKENPLLLVLDGITDPHNLGACIRSADAAGANLVIVPRHRSARLNGTVRKVASGSAENIPFLQVTNLVRTLQLLRKYNIFVIGTVIQSNQIIFNIKLVGPVAFVMGSESNGIRYLTRRNCDKLVTIPMLGVVGSLNVSVATGICLFETLRQRGY